MKNKNTFKPYLINAFFTWSIDSGLTPLIEIDVKKNKLPICLSTQSMIILNIHTNSVRNLVFTKNLIEFEAKIKGTFYKLSIEHNNINKIFNKEDGYGLEFVHEENINIGEKLTHKNKNFILIKNDEYNEKP